MVDEIDIDAEYARSELVNQINQTGIFKTKTEYLLIGDEPMGGKGVLDLKTMLDEKSYDSLKQYLTFMPRQMLWDFFSKKIWPNLPWDIHTPAGPNDVLGDTRIVNLPTQLPSRASELYGTNHQKKGFEDMVWGAFIELFNEANLSYVNQNQIEPWAWEEQKIDAYYISQSKEAIEGLESQINEFEDVSLALDPKAKAVMEAYTKLKKLGDVGLEINRQNAVKELLRKRDYTLAQAVVDAYRYAEDTVLGEELQKPIPFDVVSEDGTMVARATADGVR